MTRKQLGRRRALTVAGSLGLAGIAAACSTSGRSAPGSKTGAAPQAGAGTPRAGGIFHSSLGLNPVSLDAQKVKGGAAHLVSGAAMSRLFRTKTAPDPKVGLSQEIENDLAVSAESPDAVTWTIKLRPDAKFHDIAPVNGHAVESEDIKATFQRAVTLTGSLAAPYLKMIDKDQIQTPANDTVVFKLKYPYGLFPPLLYGTTSSFILPREALAGTYDPAKQIIGSGPFVLQDFTPDVAVTFKKNSDWFQQGEPYIDDLQFAVIPSAAQRLAQFSAGKLDELLPDVDSLASAKSQNPQAEFVSAPSVVAYQLYGHLDSPDSPYLDIRVRRALSLAIDREAIGKVVFNGEYHNNGVMGSAGKGALAPDQLGPASQYFKYDPAQAKKLVEESGAAEQFVAMLYPSGNYGAIFDKIAQMVNPMLNAAGFKTQLVALDYNRQWIGNGQGVYYGHYPNNNLVLAIWFGAGDTADTTLIQSLLPTSPANHTRVNDPQLTDMLTKIQGETDESKRLQSVQEIQRYVADKMYYVASIPTGNDYFMVQPWVENYCYSFDAPLGALGTDTYGKLWLTK